MALNLPEIPLVRSDDWTPIPPDSEEANRPIVDGLYEETDDDRKKHNEAEEAEFFKWWEEKCAQEDDLETKYEDYVLFRTIRDPTWRDDVPPLHEDLRRAREAYLRGV